MSNHTFTGPQTFTFKLAQPTGSPTVTANYDLQNLDEAAIRTLAVLGFKRAMSVATKDVQGDNKRALMVKISDQITAGQYPTQFETGGLDETTKVALKLAESDILSRLGLLGKGADAAIKAKAAQHEKGKKYFTTSAKSGNTYPNGTAILDYITRHDAAADEADRFMVRAQVIVDAQSAAPVDVDLEEDDLL
jgi:hypothetical protein